MSMQTEIKTLFSHLGKSTLEADTYLACLTLGSGTAAQIAHKVGDGRTKVYFHIKKLVAEGLLKESRKGRAPIYLPLPPSAFAAKVTDWASDLRTLVPQMESLQSATAHAPLIEISESRIGYMKIYAALSALPTAGIFRVLQGRQSLESELRILDEQTLQHFLQNLIDRQIITKGIFTEEALDVPQQRMSAENLERFNRRPLQVVTIPESVLTLQQVMFIYEQTVAFLFPETALVMTITHQGIADTLTATFDALHHFGKN